MESSKLLQTGFTLLPIVMALAACGGGGDTRVATALPPPASVMNDVFGARGTTLVMLPDVQNCPETTSYSWKDASGKVLGTEARFIDSMPEQELVATASCGSATSTATLERRRVYAANSAFAVLNPDNTVSTWGHPVWGGLTTAFDPVANKVVDVAASLVNVKQIIGSERAFAAVKTDGTVVSWGSSLSAGGAAPATAPLVNVESVLGGSLGYLARMKDGSVSGWGAYRKLLDSGGAFLGHDQVLTPDITAKLKNVKSWVSNQSLFAALNGDGTVLTWGDTRLYPWLTGEGPADAAQLKNVTQLIGSTFDFAALKNDGSVYTWGAGYAISAPIDPAVQTKLVGVSKLYSAGDAFAALKTDGSVVTWSASGVSDNGGDSSKVTSQLTNVSEIFSNQVGFAALRKDGSVVAWGDANRSDLGYSAASPALIQIRSITSTETAFAALKQNGGVVTWGDPERGGDSSAVAASLLNVVAVYSNDLAFAALKADGSVVTWGAPEAGGDSSAVKDKLTGIRAIYATPYGGFVAIAANGQYVTWGGKSVGGDSSEISKTLSRIPYFKSKS